METTTENNLEKVELPSTETPVAASSVATDIISQFDETLGKHLDQLLGARQGIEALPLNIFTVSCLILLATRETEIESFPYLPPERYTHESLLENISEMNIEHGGDLESYINSMFDKGYIKIENDGRLFPCPPIMKMALLFDRIFPRMPGLNLVAYLGQMIDEVISNRKELRVALSQFDQMLNLHGVSLIRDAESAQKEASKAFPHLKISESSQPIKKKVIPTEIKPSDIYSKLQTKNWVSTQPKHETSVPSFEPEPREICGESSRDFSSNGSATSGISQHAEAKDQIHESATSIGKEKDLRQEEIYHDYREPTGYAGRVSSTNESELIHGDDQEIDSGEKLGQPEDDDIEKRIAAFEDQLGMACPLCRTSGILPRTTAKGKFYYKCSNEECNFISWGKPYYITCPTCENPFLIEAHDSQGNAMLKCPRATCPHWQKFPWEEDPEADIKSLESGQPGDAVKKTRRLVRRKKRVVVRRKS
jgi:hypothetical protein